MAEEAAQDLPSRRVIALQDIDSAYLIAKVKKPTDANHGTWAYPGMRAAFVGGAIVTMLAFAKTELGILGVVGGSAVILLPFVNFLWDLFNAIATLAAEYTTEQQAIDKAKTRIKDKKTVQSLNIGSAKLLLVANTASFVANPAVHAGLPSLLAAAFLPLAPFEFVIGSCICLYSSLLELKKARQKCDPECLLNDRFEKSRRSKLDVAKFKYELEKKLKSGHKDCQQAAHKLHKKEQELERLELQQIALAKQVIDAIEDGALKSAKADTLAKRFSDNNYPEITKDKLLQTPTTAERNLADYLIEKQKAEAAAKLWDTFAWLCATIGMGLIEFAVLFPPLAPIIGGIAIVFLIFACGIKGYQLLDLGTSKQTPIHIMKGKISAEFCEKYPELRKEKPSSQEEVASLEAKRDAMVVKKEGKSLPSLIKDSELKKFDQLRCMIAWELCKQKVLDEQRMIIPRDEPKDIEEQLREHFDTIENAFFQEILAKTPDARKQYLAQAFEEYAERRALEAVGEDIHKQCLGAKQDSQGFVKGFSAGDKARIAKGESKLTAASAFWKKSSEAKLEVTAAKEITDNPPLVPEIKGHS